jgi:hypothetical protein
MGVRDFGKVTGARKSAGYNVVSSLQNEVFRTKLPQNLDSSPKEFGPRGRLGTRMRRGVVRAKGAVYSDGAIILVFRFSGKLRRRRRRRRVTENRTHHVGTLSSV